MPRRTRRSPAAILAAARLLGSRAWGYLIAGVLLALDALLRQGIVSNALFQHGADQSISLAIVPLLGLFALGSPVLAVRYLRSLSGGLRAGV